ncbi:hypothetical protein BSPLISOX_229 [uncultured Gammaproteobacteria bacterium]|nr:hypothetical protein BSPLISOX_229 [uncultured Gammaproteobacteria bacterium]
MIYEISNSELIILVISIGHRKKFRANKIFNKMKFIMFMIKKFRAN